MIWNFHFFCSSLIGRDGIYPNVPQSELTANALKRCIRGFAFDQSATAYHSFQPMKSLFIFEGLYSFRISLGTFSILLRYERSAFSGVFGVSIFSHVKLLTARRDKKTVIASLVISFCEGNS